MRSVWMSMLGLALAISTAACGSKKADPGVGSGAAAAMAGSGSAAMAGSGSAAMAGSGSAAMAGSGSAAVAGSGSAGSGSAMAAGSDAGSGAGSADVAMQHHAGMCPSTVLGSTTKAELKAGKVIVTITATDKDAILAIQKRAETLLKDKADHVAAGSTTSGHDQKGTHGGGIGLCPVYVPEGASATAKNDATGVVVTITPSGKDKPEDFKGMVDTRITKAADWVKDHIKPGDEGNTGGVGGGKGSDGSNHSGKGDGKGKERAAAAAAASKK